MNPPFTRNTTRDWEGATRAEDYVKQFRGLSTTLDTQPKCRIASKGLPADVPRLCWNASAFVRPCRQEAQERWRACPCLARFRSGRAMSWQGFRRLIGRSYADVEVLSITSNGGGISFSADTSIAECLVIARRTMPPQETHGEICIIGTPPARHDAGFDTAQAIGGLEELRSIEDGPYGGTPIIGGRAANGRSYEVARD